MKGRALKTVFFLQRKEQIVRPNILGNHSFPVFSWRRKDLLYSEDEAAVETALENAKVINPKCEYLIEKRTY